MMRKLWMTAWLSVFVCAAWAQSPLTKAEVRESMRRVADWQIAHFKEVRHVPVSWVNSAFYIGLVKWAEIAERDNADRSYYDWIVKLGQREGWQLDKLM